MYDFEHMDKRLLIYAHIFLLANRLQLKMDAAMTELTTKQWLLLATLGIFEQPPTLGQLADAANCSHQNTKQIANKLADKGFVTITTDADDRRTLRIAATDKLGEWDNNNHNNSEEFVNRMFAGLTPQEIETTNTVIQKLYGTLGTF